MRRLPIRRYPSRPDASWAQFVPSRSPTPVVAGAHGLPLLVSAPLIAAQAQTPLPTIGVKALSPADTTKSGSIEAVRAYLANACSDDPDRVTAVPNMEGIWSVNWRGLKDGVWAAT